MEYKAENDLGTTTSDANETLKSQQLKQLKILQSKLNLNYEASKEDPYDFIFVVFHGIGATNAALEGDYKTLKYTIESVRRYWFYRRRIKIHLHVTNWKQYIVDAENTLFDNVYIDTVKDARRVIALSILDICFYHNPRYCDFLLTNVARDVNTEITRLRNHPSGKFKNSKLVMIGYSMGTVIVHELLCGVPERLSNLSLSERPRLEHKPDYFFSIGSPLACSTIFQSPQILTTGLELPDYCKCFNVFHPYDPIACRWERLIYRNQEIIPDPVLLPYWQNNGFRNWYDWDRSMQQAKSMIVDNISDVASSISKSIFGWWGQSENDSVLESNVSTTNNRAKAFENFRMKLKYPSRTDGLDNSFRSCATNTNCHNSTNLSSILPAEGAKKSKIEAVQVDGSTTDDYLLSDEEAASDSAKAFANLTIDTTLPIRYDYQLQEDATEHYLNPLAIVQSHTNYWGSKDVALFILKTLINDQEQLPVTSLLASVKAKAKRLSQKAVDEDLKKQFLILVEIAKNQSDALANKDLQMKPDVSSGIAATWSALTRSTNEQSDILEYRLSDAIDSD
ncbi:bifunctional DDHD domain/Alpha-Beta hydrolase fold [Babesia duncani]|uniref:Bifunctional DDHD domain/Alpha-Beta hydrolase fold n=1 Tax=Babesia duncani TaxID=323732 RepID=A0AAD9UQ96_9APIC|nr:bifunctional DDHD domain/Alpha-Beta hydrolase fold [Babesia duncani]